MKEETADCLLRTICEANQDSSRAGEVTREAVEVGTFLLLSRLPLRLQSTSVSADLVMAARVGRLNYGGSLAGGGERETHLIYRAGTVCSSVQWLSDIAVTALHHMSHCHTGSVS